LVVIHGLFCVSTFKQLKVVQNIHRKYTEKEKKEKKMEGRTKERKEVSDGGR
jgi:hypothetical protein